MRICLYWYSATGNTMNLARAARDWWREHGIEVVSFDMLNHRKKVVPAPEAFDKVVFAFPAMVFRTPEVARRFVVELAPATKPVEAWLMLSSGGMGARTDREFSGLLAQKGITLAGACELVCTDSYIPFRKYLSFMQKKGLPDDGTRRGAEEFASAVAGMGGRVQKAWSGPVRAFFSWVGRRAPREAASQLLGPRRLDGERCTGCKLCVKLCPTGAIHMEGNKPNVKEHLCVGCLACFNNCPTGAWRLKRFALSYHYSFPQEKVWEEL